MIKIGNKTYYDCHEVAKKFGVHTSTVARWRKSGLLHSFRVNKRKRVNYPDTKDPWVCLTDKSGALGLLTEALLG